MLKIEGKAQLENGCSFDASVNCPVRNRGWCKQENNLGQKGKHQRLVVRIPSMEGFDEDAVLDLLEGALTAIKDNEKPWGWCDNLEDLYRLTGRIQDPLALHLAKPIEYPRIKDITIDGTPWLDFWSGRRG